MKELTAIVGNKIMPLNELSHDIYATTVDSTQMEDKDK